MLITCFYLITNFFVAIAHQLYRANSDVTIETTPNEVYGIKIDGIETQLNDHEVYGIEIDEIETAPNEVYGIRSGEDETSPDDSEVTYEIIY